MVSPLKGLAGGKGEKFSHMNPRSVNPKAGFGEKVGCKS